jgi:hypothetical protein
MSSRKERIDALIRYAISGSALSEAALECVDEIHRNAIRTAHEISGHYDRWGVAYEVALYKEVQKLQRAPQRLQEKGSIRNSA